MPDMNPIDIARFRYGLPDHLIAKYPLPDRDSSRLLLYRKGAVSHHRFNELPGLVPAGSWMVFNNTRVIQARLSFRKATGAVIEVFCLEPVDPPDYQQAFESARGCRWKCMVGNARKWKSGPVSLVTRVKGKETTLEACLEQRSGDSYVVRFGWNSADCSFGEIIESAGSTPIPPYLKRDAEEDDKTRYQTIYNRDPGSVAAPTAGLHFTDGVLEELKKKGIPGRELTLHVGAGTFVPVKHDDARQHAMHAELVTVSLEFLEYWSNHPTGLVAVGTTSTRTLETLYWLGVRLCDGDHPDPSGIVFNQWENETLPDHFTLGESLAALTGYCHRHQLDHLRFSTSLMIVPGYRFRTISGLLTNFHLPGSTLLLLIAAFIGEDWRNLYASAVENRYRFLSYGDSSLLLPG